MLARIRKNDTVIVLSGKDKGKKGKILEVATQSRKVIVEGVAIVTRHAKARRQGQVSEIQKKESLIDLSKVMLVCVSCHVPSRVSARLIEDGTKRVRVCKRCDQIT